MMAEIIAPQKTVEVTFSLEPAYNIIGSLSLLDWTEDFTGLGEWVYQTAKALSPEQLRTHQLVLHDAHVHLLDASWSSFPEWVDDLATQDAIAMRDRALQVWLTRVSTVVDGEIPTPSKLLANRAAYMSLVEDSSHLKGQKNHDHSFWEEMHSLLNDPPARQELIVTHLRTMWDEVLALEWERNLPVLEESITAFESLNLSGLTAVEALSRVILRAQLPQEATSWLANLEHITFIPSAHTGPYLVHLSGLCDTKWRFLFGARIPEGASVHLPALSRSELLMRLTALADDTRLRILELLGQKGEMGTPDIKSQLELSQSAASRHLEHLTATGYLIARRHQGTKLFKLNPSRIDHTFDALKEFCQIAS
ncbi:MAG: winged helix-turn-helix transcriptional regulator [Chloroflexi bacterium]|nr:winged helix-turn-helix transcriptional regulator [Chloroflexota bacterium]